MENGPIPYRHFSGAAVPPSGKAAEAIIPALDKCMGHRAEPTLPASESLANPKRAYYPLLMAFAVSITGNPSKAAALLREIASYSSRKASRTPVPPAQLRHKSAESIFRERAVLDPFSTAKLIARFSGQDAEMKETRAEMRARGDNKPLEEYRGGEWLVKWLHDMRGNPQSAFDDEPGYVREAKKEIRGFSGAVERERQGAFEKMDAAKGKGWSKRRRADLAEEREKAVRKARLKRLMG